MEEQLNIKYIYFEVNEITGFNFKEKTIENENVLLIKPNTNSSGIWGYTNMTERKSKFDVSSFSIVNQYWIDLEKYNREDNKFLNNELDIVLNRLDHKLSEIANRSTIPK